MKPVPGETIPIRLRDEIEDRRGAEILIDSSANDSPARWVQIKNPKPCEAVPPSSRSYRRSVGPRARREGLGDRSKHDQDFMSGLGATAIDYRAQTVEQYVETCTQGEGFDVIVETLGGATLDACFVAVKQFGHVVSAQPGIWPQFGARQSFRAKKFINDTWARSRARPSTSNGKGCRSDGTLTSKT